MPIYAWIVYKIKFCLLALHKLLDITIIGLGFKLCLLIKSIKNNDVLFMNHDDQINNYAIIKYIYNHLNI